MRITIYNANDSTTNTTIDSQVAQLENSLKESNHDVCTVILRNLNIKYCNGCWGCWVKEPGKCVTNDDMPVVHQSFIESDLVIFFSPLKMGFPNALMKKVNDKLVPMVHPYIVLVDKECHHLARYDHYPEWGLVLQPEEDTDEADIELIRSIYERTSLNLKSALRFTLTTNSSIKEIAHEIDHI